MNNQQVSKIVNFFRINYQFHDPYQLLLDGNFIKLLVEKGIDLKRKFENTIKGKANLKVTSCIIRQLQLLGDQFKLVLEQARKYKTIFCKHPLEYSVDNCILDQLRDDNQKLNIVCTQDIELRRHLRTLNNVPMFYFGPDQRITMEDIPKYSLKEIKKQAELKYLPNEKETKQVIEYKRKLEKQEKKKRIRQLSSLHGIQIKTKIAKGPNPLSVKKKQKKIANGFDQPIIQKQKRIRKRNKKNKPTSNQ